MNEILNLIWITLFPLLELRGSIPYGILKSGLSWPVVFAVCVIANILVIPITFFILDYFKSKNKRLEDFSVQTPSLFATPFAIDSGYLYSDLILDSLVDKPSAWIRRKSSGSENVQQITCFVMLLQLNS